MPTKQAIGNLHTKERKDIQYSCRTVGRTKKNLLSSTGLHERLT